MFQPVAAGFSWKSYKRKNDSYLSWVLQWGIVKDDECMFRDIILYHNKNMVYFYKEIRSWPSHDDMI
jgi:hypothetical protein